MQYLYLHGFASSPQSRKAQFFANQFAAGGRSPLMIPDLNQGDFSRLTLTRQMTYLKSQYLDPSESFTIIGSSLGGLTAAWLGQHCPQVKRIVLLAPAFGFIHHWRQRLSPAQLATWQQSGWLRVYHYGDRQEKPLAYDFVTDALGYDETQLQREVPTLILHGRQDEVVPVTVSEAYAAERPWVKLQIFNSDHALTDVLPQLWQASAEFLGVTGDAFTPLNP
ncbi:MAG: YqiA/YcfP family alpha/beta fold hydrolase [Synechocystis sp.]